MAANQGYATDPQAWARARLRRGTSIGEIWEINAEYPEARLTLGTDGSAGWQIEAHGVRPFHCELFWDGQSLWVADTQQAGGVFLDGQRVRDWMQVQGPAEIRFGQASLDIETSAPPSQRMVSSPQLARPVTVTDATAHTKLPDMPRETAGVFGGAAGDPNIPDLDAAATAIAKSPIARPNALEGARTEMVVTPESRGLDLRPRLGGGGGAPAKPHAAEATKMVAMPIASPAHAPAPPMLGSPAAVVAPPPASPATPAMRMPPPAPPPPAPPAPPMPMAPPAPPMPMAPPMAPVMPPGPAGPAAFAAPPEPAAPKEKPESWLVRTLKHEKSVETEGKQALPLRTWILLAVTVLVTVGWLLWDDTPEPTAAPPPPDGAVAVVPGGPAPATEPAVEPTPPEVATVEPSTVEPGTVEPGIEPSTVVPSTVEPSSPPDVGSEPAEDEEGATLQRRAADAYMAGRHQDALALYRRLAAQDPESTTWPAMVRILERRLAPAE